MNNHENKREKLLKTFKDYQTWQLVLILILYSFVVAILLRLNNVGMVSRRDAVKAADQEGNGEITKNRLVELRSYVNAHMNTSTGRFFLEGQFTRDIDGLIQKAEQEVDKNPNGNVYKKASEVCDPQFTYRSSAYFQCYMNELAKYPTVDYGSTEIKPPNPNAYQIEFNSPRWTPDFAGFALVLWFILVVVILGRLLAKGILLLILKRREKLL